MKYPDMSAAQLYDWIKERKCLETLDFQERCFRDYVRSVREEYDIKKPESSRQYEAMDELPPGKQAQVDMGEIILETITGRHKKIYCFGMVMTHSRYKFILWKEMPFTTDTFVQAHIKAFTFLGGRPQEIVYDQDKILAVSENHGDIKIKTMFSRNHTFNSLYYLQIYINWLLNCRIHSSLRYLTPVKY